MNPNPTHPLLKPNSFRLRPVLSLMLAILMGAAGWTARAADANPPARLTYQGFLVDANGTPLANTAVANYDVVFRIYAASQGGTAIWAEQQTVTVDKGNFAVILGEGSTVNSEPRPSLDTAFTGTDVSDRYIGITVLGLGGGNAEIAPRLRLLTSPFAFLAKNATALVSGSGAPLLSTINGGFQTVGGNARGTSAVDLQTTRTDVAQVASGNYSVVAGGQNNRATAINSTVSGGTGSTASGLNSTVGGGIENVASGTTTTIGGGYQNVSSSTDSVIGGGHRNTNTAFVATVGGGQYNLAGGTASTVGGGFKNNATAVNATIAGGAENVNQGITASIGGGYKNVASGLESTIAGGSLNQATVDQAAVGGGVDNRATGFHSVIAGGHTNKATAINSTVSGGYGNVAGGGGSSVGGGDINQATGFESRIGGGLDNRATNDRSTIGGGHLNTSSGINSVIGGGYSNLANNNESTVGGGNINVASGVRSTVAGGVDNQATGNHATIGGGHLNRASGLSSVVAGGYNNRATAQTATVGGGDSNLASGSDSFVAGGYLNEATGLQSFAAGRRAKSWGDGIFTFADRTDLDFGPNFANSFNVRASGGTHFYSNGTTWLNANRTGVFLAPGSSSWAFVSDRNAKKNFEAANYKEVLEKLDQVSVSYWNYKAEADGTPKNLGPVAQDFKQTFYPGRDDKSITTLELDGVEMAAIKGLHQLVKEKDSEIKSLKNELQELRGMVESLAKSRSGSQP